MLFPENGVEVLKDLFTNCAELNLGGVVCPYLQGLIFVLFFCLMESLICL